MTRREAITMRLAIEKAATTQTDADAINSVWMFPAWSSDVEYAVGDRVQHADRLWRCEQQHTSQLGWEPDDTTRALWTPVSVDDWPEWIQPTGAQDAYQSSDKVSHADKHWISIVDNNVWEPSFYGWEEIK